MGYSRIHKNFAHGKPNTEKYWVYILGMHDLDGNCATFQSSDDERCSMTEGDVLYLNWPAADALGSRGTQSLIDEAGSLMPLLIMATLGTLMVLGGLYLLISDMMSSATGMNKQLLSIASVLVVLTMAFFITGMGSNVSVINFIQSDLS